MKEISATIVPLGSLAIIFGSLYIVLLLRKSIVARKADETIKIRMKSTRKEKNESLEEQKRRLELLIKK